MSLQPELHLTKDAALLDALFSGQMPCRAASAAVRVKMAALYRAYGTAYPFCSFYISRDGHTCAALYEGALLFSDERDLGVVWNETVRMLPVGSILSDTMLRLPHMRQRTGDVMAAWVRAHRRNEETSCCADHIGAAYRVLSSVFPADYQVGTPQERDVFMRWYAEMSQYVRHGAAKLYAMPDKSAAVVLLSGADALLSQLGVRSEARGMGYGSRLINAVLDNLDVGRLLVFSRNEDTNRFYRKNGFLPAGKWYDYCAQD